ncbi:hypothetical protein TrRE_jg3784, partial [Triparma retinervis]
MSRGLAAKFATSAPSRAPPVNIYINGTGAKEVNGTVYLKADDLAEILESYVSRELENYVSRESLSNYTMVSTPSSQLSSSSSPSSSFSYPRLIASPLSKLRDTRSIRPSSNATNLTTVAFPQPVDLTPSILTNSCMIMTALVMAVFLSSIAPNLWLVGGGVGALYGNEVADGYNKVQQLPLEERRAAKPASVVGKFIVKMGKKLASYYIFVTEFVNSIWFMYKTGQLSYAYFKQYERLDERFRVQEKMDAWNAKFQEGKQNFDKWERENEVGRKVLAGLRTAWLVEQNSLKRNSNARSAKKKAKRVAKAVLDPFRGNGIEELKLLMNGLKIELQTMDYETVSRRAASGFMAFAALNLVGVVFSLAPGFLALLGLGAGAIWPGWIAGGWSKIKQSLEETKIKGRGGNLLKQEQNRDGFSFFVDGNGGKQFY